MRTLAKDMDSIDKKILRLLQQNGRATNQWLAKQVDLSPTPCLERVRRLERDGVIAGYKAIIPPQKVGYSLLLYAFVSFDHASSSVYEEFSKGIAAISEIVECHMITGNYDFIMKILARDIAHFRKILEEKILPLPSVRITHSYVSMHDAKPRSIVPIED